MLMNWTPAALSRDIPPGSAAPGHLGENDLVIWRSASGRIAAWSDRCPHRGMRLSHGFVRGEFLSCIYHGWRYGDGGQCNRIPAHPDLTPPDAIKVPVFAVAEVAGVIWVAPKDAAPEAAPADFPGLEALRTLRVSAGAETVAAVLGGQGGAIRCEMAGCPVVVLIQPLPGQECNLHVLADAGADAGTLDRVSAALEALRRDAEAREEVSA